MANPYIQSLGTLQPSGDTQPQVSSSNSFIQSLSAPATEVSQPQQQALQQSLVSKAKPLIAQAKPVAKSLIQSLTGFVKGIPSHVKAAVKHPAETFQSVQEQTIINFGGAVSGYIEKGITSAIGVKVPERFDILKQREYYKELRKIDVQNKPEDVKKAVATGNFIGSFVPYVLASDLAAATIGTKLLTPVVSKIAPKLIKIVPLINNAVGFTGVGQLEYDKETDGTRVDRIKNDVIMLALFETGGLLAKGIAKGTSKLISKTVEEVSNKFKSGKPIPIEELEQSIIETKAAIKKDTGKPAEVTLATNIANASDKELNNLVTPKVNATDESLITEYRSKFNGQLLNADNVRELYKPQGYNRINSAEFHDRASTLTNKIFQEDLKTLKPGDNYLFTAGSSGSGKSSSLLTNFPKDVKAGLDGNFSTNNSIAKLEDVIATGAKPQIAFFYREPLDAWNSVIERATNPKNGRVVPMDVFLENLEGSRQKVLEAYRKFGDKVDIQVIDNSLGKGNARLVSNPIAFLEKISYNIVDVKRQILDATQKQIKNGTISKETGQALLGKTVIGQPQPKRPSGRTTPIKAKPKVEVSKATIPKEIEGKPSKVGLDIEAKAVEKRLTESFGGTAEYSPTTIKEQSKIITSLTQDMDRVNKILSGEEPKPSNVRIGMLFKELEAQAIKNKDVDLLRRLANSPLSSETSIHASELRFLAEREPNSPVKVAKDIIKAREERLAKRYAGKTAKEVTKKYVEKGKAEMKPPKLTDWGSIIKEVRC